MSGIALSGRRRAAWFLVFWVVIGVASYVLGVRNPLGQRAEDSVLGAAEFTTDPPAPLNLVSVPSVAIALVLIGAIAWVAHGFQRALVVTVVPAAAVIASQLLKLRLLSRPELFSLDAPNTFPSGHMTVFAALTAALIWAVPSAARAFVSLGGTVLVAVAGWQLLAYGWHRPSDVYGGVALAVVAFACAALVRPARSRGTAVLGRVLSVGLALVGWIVAGGAIILAVAAAYAGNSTLLLTAGEFGAVGAAALAMRSMLLLGSGRR
ncbi:phosphatase PAP2 family protein [Leucobacter sp. USHLN153]|uniref:phosphatase PAP2 family protein n=1 Tax=Leucobacter sp. USHLN153 TaxID=3081268 RepID=UPI003016C96F